MIPIRVALLAANMQVIEVSYLNQHDSVDSYTAQGCASFAGLHLAMLPQPNDASLNGRTCRFGGERS